MNDLPMCSGEKTCPVGLKVYGLENRVIGMDGRLMQVERNYHDLDMMITAMEPPGLAPRVSRQDGFIKGVMWTFGGIGVLLVLFLGYLCNQQIDTNHNIQQLNNTMIQLIERMKAEGVISHVDPSVEAHRELPQIATE